MKPFNLDAAKAGKPLVTRDGRKVTEFHHFSTIRRVDCCLAVTEDGDYNWYRDNGKYLINDEHNKDLFLADEEVTVWVNVYKGEEVHGLGVGSMHETDVYAELAARVSQRKGYIGAFPLTIKL